MKPRVGVLISGRGSNMQALIRAAANADYPAEVALVISNRADAVGLDIARQHGIAARAIPSRNFRTDRAGHEVQIHEALIGAGCTIVCLAGYMRLLTPEFVTLWAGRMLNIHPSLLPAFPGLDTHARALAAGVKIHGCTVHLVTAAMDEGPILAQAAVPVLPDDTETVLGDRVLTQEHIIYPMALLHYIDSKPTHPESVAALLSPCA
ncbi:phosphoribosylglycinamide formyltransferase [Acidiphilium sp. PA]|uniref:phosphoribosylglycinamide formyltransferase n=1 Tax=Acidiphilium sp. PA TaxID=2871705 RepID=UPI0022448D0C|nr:phosphoribosylglycinamide formyltransferase [Acidiphilium sp. PA]MCW8308517.1 phosphoribosylglycinamide formyltransferase [Acidiphilium sp. PA]